jgi:alpha-galactosidase
MIRRAFLLIVAACFAMTPQWAQAVSPNADEMSAARRWAARFEGVDDAKPAEAKDAAAAAMPFSFVYDGKPSSELLKGWKCQRSSQKLDENRTERTLVYSDPQTGLTVRCIGIEYGDFPAVEWVVYFKNAGEKDTPILSDIQAINGGMPLARDRQAVLRYAKGSECRFDDFAPQWVPLGPTPETPQGGWVGEGNPVRLQSREGRSSCGTLPFFNIDAGNEGVIYAVGWTGDWAASIYRTDTEARVRAGMVRTHLKLLPGEEIRSPRMVLLFWTGERMHGHNLWRRFVVAHHVPRQDGKPAKTPVSLATWGGNFAKNHIEHGKWWKDNNLPLDYLWVDAGWYGKDEAKIGATVFNSNWGALVGDWFPNPGYFPEGLGPVGKALKDMGMGFLLWLEPERVFQGTQWTREHPEFLLGPMGPNYLFNLGNPAARQALTDHLVKLIQDGNLACYRQDFNFDPRPYWDKADAPDRVGMTEIQHITGLYRMWDDLLARCPGLLIDNCSSGGRRIDIETISRSIPLWRSDLQCYPNYAVESMQNQTQGLGLWAPLSAGACDRETTYAFRSAIGPGMDLIMYEFEKDTNKHFSIEWLRKMLGELNQVRDLFYGDFYPLTSYSFGDDVWAAWQFDRAEQNRGAVFAFRRPQCPFGNAVLKLHGLEPDAVYVVTNVDVAGTTEATGRELMEKGLAVSISETPGAVIVVYARKN